jgi:DNA repair protein RecO
MPTSVTTSFLVLRKTIYAESSLVVAGLTPDAGQVHFLVRGARRLSSKVFPIVDLFRILTVNYVPRERDLLTWRSAELDRAHDGLAHNLRTYRTATWLAGLALANTHQGVAAPDLFTALELALARLATGSGEVGGRCSEARVCVSVTLLEELGQLPEGRSPAEDEQLRSLLQHSRTAGSGFRLTPDTWHRLEAWSRQLLVHAELHLPSRQP